MTIDQNIFRNELSKAFIELLDSRRGVATELAKAIGKPSSFVSQVKRGRPVNSVHLKAVGIIFGSQKVIELLGIEKDNDKKKSIDQKLQFEKESNISDIENQDLIARFKNPEMGLQNNEHLLGIENASEELYKRVSEYIKTNHEAAKIIKGEERKKIS